MSLTLRSLTSPTLLGAFDPALLHALLAPHRTFFARKGCILPENGVGEIDLVSISTALMADASDFPVDLAEALAVIGETGTDQHMGAIQAAAHRAQIEVRGVDGSASPMDMAARLWLEQPDLLRRIHAEASLPAAKRWESWRCRWSEIPPFQLPEDPEALLTGWAQDLNAILQDHHFGAGARIFVCPAGRLTYILIRHGATLQRLATHHDDGTAGNLVYRPAVTDVLRYDPVYGELGIHLQKHSKWLAEAIRTTFALHVFNQPHLFSGERRYTLEPLQSRGESALDCSGHPTLASVSLTEIEFSYSDVDDGKTIHRSANVFTFLRNRGIVLGDQPCPSAAKLKFIFEDGAERTATIRFPNVATYQRVGDDDVVGAFLLEQGFALAQAGEERSGDHGQQEAA
ncbi:hypothetical protein LBMAG53_19970 [Planctomycetota bacterium]|nr:hypothetical protein LBMAG53_19970 [Planctomycetota bacterium]